MTLYVSRLLDLPPLTAAAAFAAITPARSVSLDVSADAPQLLGPTPAVLAAVAERMFAWVDEWIDAACDDVFVHPALRPRPAPRRP